MARGEKKRKSPPKKKAPNKKRETAACGSACLRAAAPPSSLASFLSSFGGCAASFSCPLRASLSSCGRLRRPSSLLLLSRFFRAAAPPYPFRFSSEYFDDETGLVYYNYRYYSPELGRWLSRDPSEERAGGLHLYGMCKNDSANVFDSLGLWLFWTHQNLTYNAFTYDLQLPYLLQTYFKHLIDLSALALKITSLVTNANVRTDFGEKKEKQQYHFCTNFADRNRMDFVALYTEALKAEMNDWDDLIVKKAFPTMENCMEALEHLGTLTHMWQDYYGHGVEYDPYLHPDDSPKRDFSIGEIKGNPDNIAMQPVTYGGEGFLGKHGGLFDIPSIEPGYRADDPDNRLKLARRFTYQKIAKMMPDWITKCHCLIRHWAN